MPSAPQPGKVPAAMKRALADLKAACEALPLHSPSPVSDPIFGDGPRPSATSIASDLPPGMAAAFANLQTALDGPPCMDGQWPFGNPPAVQAAIDVQKVKGRGRPSSVEPHQVVRLARFVRLGDPLKAAAEKAKIKRRTAERILAGQHSMCRHPAVLAAGVDLRPATSTPTTKIAQKAGNGPRSASNQKDRGQAGSAPPAASSPSIPEPPAEGVPNLAGQALKGRP